MTMSLVPQKVLPQGIPVHKENMKAQSLSIRKLWPMLKFVVKTMTLTLKDVFDYGTTERSYHKKYTCEL